MTVEELKEKLELIQKMKCDSQTLELKSARYGCPKQLYDTLSSFSNQDEGGIIIWGIDEEQGYKENGVYDPQDIQKKINEQCLQMMPINPDGIYGRMRVDQLGKVQPDTRNQYANIWGCLLSHMQFKPISLH